MKIVEPAIHELLKNLASGAVYALRAPDGAPGPFVIFQRTDRDQFGKNFMNRSANMPGLVQAVMQIDAYAPGYYQAKELSAAIETILDGYSGTVYYGGNSPQDFVIITGASLQNDVDILDQTDRPLLFRVSNSYLITYQQ